MYLLDTNICIAFIKGHQSVVDRFEQERKNCTLPVIVVSELYKGAYCSQRVKENLNVLVRFVSPLSVINLDLAAAQEFGLIQSELRQLGRPTNDMDALIAAIARSRSATLVTNNTRDFENIPKLKLEDWLA